SVTRAALEQGFGELLTCIAPEGAVASATLFLFDATTAYYWLAANDPAYRKAGCATCLMIENLRRCLAKGLQAVDMVGINSPNRGYFKTSFNALAVPYFLLTWERPLDTFASVGARRFDSTFPDADGPKLAYRPGHTLDQPRPALAAIVQQE